MQFFDSKKDIQIQVDASGKGVGAVLLQDGGSIEYASKSLSDAETRYSNIECEMLSELFGLERFHCYAYGSKVTNHKPLIAIFSKNVHKAPTMHHQNDATDAQAQPQTNLPTREEHPSC